LRRVLRIGWKDVRITARDRSALLILLAMPAVLILILNMAFGNMSGTSDPVPTRIVNNDRGEIGKRIVDGFTGSEDIKRLTTVKVTKDESAARLAVAKGDVAAVLVIPSDFTAKVESATPVTMEVLGDPGRQVSASIFAGVAQAIGTRISAASVGAQTSVEALRASRLIVSPERFGTYIADATKAMSTDAALTGVTIEVRGAKAADDAPTFNGKDFYGPAQISLFLLFGSMFGAFAMLRERRENTLARLLTTPARREEIVGGKMAGIWVVGVLQFVVLLVFTLAIGTNWGSVPGALVIGAAEAFAATGLAMVYVGFGKTERAVGAIGPTVAILMGAAGGSWMPTFAMPDWLKPLHYFTINGWALDGFYALQLGKPFSAVVIDVVVLIVMGLVLGAIGVSRLRWER
jgi:linearmycin/streptolysin S transport system permease protein